MTCGIGSIHGHGTGGATQTLAETRSQVHPDDLSNLDAAFAASGRAGGSYRAEYRLAPLTDHERMVENAGSRSKVRSCAKRTADPCNCLGSPATSLSASMR